MTTKGGIAFLFSSNLQSTLLPQIYKCGSILLLAGGVFSTSKIFFRRDKGKKSQGLYREKRVNVLENRHTALSKMMSCFWPCDLRRCYVTNKYHRYPSSIDVFGRIWQAFLELFPVKPCIH